MLSLSLSIGNIACNQLALSKANKQSLLSHQSTSPAPCLAGGACENEEEEEGEGSPPRLSSGRLPLSPPLGRSSRISAVPTSAAPPMTAVRRVAAARRSDAAAAAAAEARAGELDVLRGSIRGEDDRENYEIEEASTQRKKKTDIRHRNFDMLVFSDLVGVSRFVSP